MKNIEKFLASLLVVVMVLTASPLSGFVGMKLNPDWLDFNTKANATTYSGTCGANVGWSFDTSTYTLTVSGAGAMDDYGSDNHPWESYEDSIKTVVINYGVTTIGEYAFYYLDSLTSITIPDSVTHIGDYAFGYCTKLTRVTIPDSVTSIGGYAFGSCTELTSITIPDSVTTISNSTFSYCKSLARVTIPDSVTSIGGSAFGSCTELTSITIPGSVTTIGDGAFTDCDSLTSVTIPGSVTSIGERAFSGCDVLENITVNKNNTVYSSDENGVLFNKDKTKLIQYPIGNGRIVYEIPDSVTSIGGLAFGSCTELTSITIPGSVTTIGDGAFIDCDSLNSVTIPGSVTTIGMWVFSGCTSLTSITIPDSVTRIGYSAFSGCTGLTSITIPDGVTSIGSYAFCGCTELTSITIPDGVTELGFGTFSGCDSLTSVEIGRGISLILENAFDECTNLTIYGYKNSYTETYAVKNEIAFVPYTSQVTFDANGGTSETPSKEVYTDCAIDELPTAENEDMVFLGWFTSTTGGELVTEDTVITQDCTLYAQWTDPVTSISLVMPSDVTYYVGDSLVNAGIKLNVNYYDGTSEIVNDGFVLTPETLSVSGTQTVTATYGNHTATAKITILPVQPVSVSTYKLPDKMTYLVGESFNPKGMKVKVTYNNSTEKIVEDMSLLDIIYDFSSAGDSIVYYTYSENGAMVSDYFEALVYTKPNVSADSISTTAGETITVPVRISGNCGLMGYNISVVYDSEVLTPVSVEQGSAISGGMFNDSIETSSSDRFNVIWSGSADVKNNGVLFNLVFEVNENAVGETTIDLDFVQADTFNESFDDIQLDVSDVTVTVNNPNYSNNLLMTMQDVSAEAGSVISLPVTLSNCNGISETVICLAYDTETFEFVKLESDSVTVEATDGDSGIIVHISGLDSELDNTEIMTFDFKVKEYSNGDFIFDLIYDPSLDEMSQSITCDGCTVSVTNPSENDPSIVYGDAVNAKVGETITVPVRIKNNNGIMGYKLTVNYDSSILNPLSVSSGEYFSGNFADNAGTNSGQFDVIWNGSSDVTQDDVVFYIEFETLGQGKTKLSLSYSQGDTFNENWEDIILNCQYISVTVHPSELIFAKTETSTVVDETDKYIFGLTAGISSLENYITVLDGYTYSFSGKIGTGTAVEVCKNDVVIDTYTFIIFGDVNGDGWYDGMDAVIVSCIASGMLTQEQAGSVICFAADCNHDGLIDENDVALLEQAGVLLSEIDQNQSVEVLETQSVYIEYADLIEQEVQQDVEFGNDTADEETEKILYEILSKFYMWILKLFSVLDFINN